MKTTSLYRGRRFPAATIAQAVRWYFRFQLSLRDVEECRLFITFPISDARRLAVTTPIPGIDSSRAAFSSSRNCRSL